MEEVEKSGALVVYELDGHHYAYHPDWERDQKTSRPSPPKHPPPPSIPGVFTESSLNAPGVLREPPVPSVTVSGTVSGTGVDALSRAAAPIPPKPEKPCECLVYALNGYAEDADATEVVEVFIGIFARAKRPQVVLKYRPHWLDALRAMRDENYTWAQIWAACGSVHADVKHGRFDDFRSVGADSRNRRSRSSAQ